MRLRFGFLFQMAALFDSLTIFDNVAFGLREHHHLRRGRGPADRRRAAPGGGPARRARAEEAGRALRRPAEARRPGPGAGARPRGDALRRADHRARPDHERRDQRADPPDPADQEDDRRGRHARHEDRRPRWPTAWSCSTRWPGSSRASRRSSTTARPRAWRTHPDPRVRQFVRGEAGERLREMAMQRTRRAAA